MVRVLKTQSVQSIGYILKKADNKCQNERKLKFKKASKIKGLERKLKREKVNIYARNA